MTRDYTSYTYYTDDYFSAPSTTYNPSLATTSICFAMASFATNAYTHKTTYTHRYQNADALLTSFGYTNLEVNEDYLK